jgi:hypothetical protein
MNYDYSGKGTFGMSEIILFVSMGMLFCGNCDVTLILFDSIYLTIDSASCLDLKYMAINPKSGTILPIILEDSLRDHTTFSSYGSFSYYTFSVSSSI